MGQEDNPPVPECGKGRPCPNSLKLEQRLHVALG